MNRIKLALFIAVALLYAGCVTKGKFEEQTANLMQQDERIIDLKGDLDLSNDTIAVKQLAIESLEHSLQASRARNRQLAEAYRDSLADCNQAVLEFSIRLLGCNDEREQCIQDMAVVNGVVDSLKSMLIHRDARIGNDSLWIVYYEHEANRNWWQKLWGRDKATPPTDPVHCDPLTKLCL